MNQTLLSLPEPEIEIKEGQVSFPPLMTGHIHL